MNRALAYLFVTGLAVSSTAAADFTHLNVDHRELVHLRLTSTGVGAACTGNFTNNAPLREVRTTGQLIDREYAVPAGKELIITDVTYFIGRTSGEWSGETLSPRLIANLVTDGSPSGFREIVSLPGIQTPQSGSAVLAGQVNYTAGIRVASRRSICTGASRVSSLGSISTETGVRFVKMAIKGYLVDKSQ